MLEKDHPGIAQRVDAIRRIPGLPLLVVAVLLARKFERTHHQQSLRHHRLGPRDEQLQLILASDIQRDFLACRIYGTAFGPAPRLRLHDN